MSKVRDLKKEVKQMGKIFLNECYTQLAFSPSVNQEYIMDIISDTMELQHSIIQQICLRNSTVGYNEIASMYYDGIVELTERLNSLDY